MVGRTPEYLGKKLESRELTLAMLYALIFPFVILGLTALAAVTPREFRRWATADRMD